MISNEIGAGHLNIVDHETLKRIIHEVLTDVASIKTTLGPGGRTNLLHDEEKSLALFSSKDGFRIVMGMHYDDYFYDAILKVIRDVSSHNNTMVGDGTTSVIVILDEFYKALESHIDSGAEDFKYISKTGIVNILDTLKDVLKEKLVEKGYIKFLSDFSVEDRKEIIAKVATVAANNDKTVGQYVAKLFDKSIENCDDELFVDITPNYHKTTDEATEIGFRLPTGYINRIYATERDGRTCIHNNPRFLLIEGPLLDGDIKVIEPIIEYVCLNQNQPLVIFADDFTKKIAQYLYTLRVGMQIPDRENEGKMITLPPLDILPIQYITSDDTGHEKMIDLEVALGGKAIPSHSQTWETIGSGPGDWEILLGGANKIISVEHDTSIVGGHGETAKIEGRIAKIHQDLDDMVLGDTPVAQMNAAVYKERIGMLKSNMVTIRVGGATFKERKYNALVYEDAVYAIKSTIKNGFTLAGQVSVNHIIKNHSEDIINETVNRLNQQGRNVAFGKYKTQIMTNAISGLLKIIRDTFMCAYRTAIEHAVVNKEEVDSIFKEINNFEEPMAYNLMTTAYESLHKDNNMFVAGNTDYETFAAIASVTGMFLNTDNLQTLYIPRLQK